MIDPGHHAGQIVNPEEIIVAMASESRKLRTLSITGAAIMSLTFFAWGTMDFLSANPEWMWKFREQVQVAQFVFGVSVSGSVTISLILLTMWSRLLHKYQIHARAQFRDVTLLPTIIEKDFPHSMPPIPAWKTWFGARRPDHDQMIDRLKWIAYNWEEIMNAINSDGQPITVRRIMLVLKVATISGIVLGFLPGLGFLLPLFLCILILIMESRSILSYSVLTVLSDILTD